MKKIGAHLSTTGGLENVPLRALEIGAQAFALWVKNSKRFFQEPLDINKVNNFKKSLNDSGLSNDFILPHASYLINLGSYDNELEQKSLESFIEEIKRCELLNLKYLNLHPGSHLNKIPKEECLEKIAKNIDIAISKTKDLTLVLENAAGQGTNVGNSFEDLLYIIKNVTNKNRIGICIDTCHLFAAGYDIRTQESSKKIFDEFFNIIDKRYFKAMHLNDSKNIFNSRKDNHESIGKGFIGLEAFKYIMNNEYFENIPMILETPDPFMWKKEIETLYSFIK